VVSATEAVLAGKLEVVRAWQVAVGAEPGFVVDGVDDAGY
jgi:hypothetical protein